MTNDARRARAEELWKQITSKMREFQHGAHNSKEFAQAIDFVIPGIIEDHDRAVEAAFAQRALREWEEIRSARLPGELPNYAQFFDWLRARAEAVREETT